MPLRVAIVASAEILSVNLSPNMTKMITTAAPSRMTLPDCTSANISLMVCSGALIIAAMPKTVKAPMAMPRQIVVRRVSSIIEATSIVIAMPLCHKHPNYSMFILSVRRRGPTPELLPQLLGRLLDKAVGVGLGKIDLGLGNFGRGLAEHGEHRLRAFRVHAAGGRVHRNGVLECGEIERLVGADQLVRHLRHDLFCGMGMNPFQRRED